MPDEKSILHPACKKAAGALYPQEQKLCWLRISLLEALATVGYGHDYPATLYRHCVATLETLVGLFGLAVLTGLIFVRFSRPTA
jgi:hypothetical protein